MPAILSRAKAGKLKLSVGRERKLSDFTYVGNLVDAQLLADEHLQGEAVASTSPATRSGETVSEAHSASGSMPALRKSSA